MMFWECRHYWPGCPEFEPDRFSELPMSYILSALDHGKRLQARDLHNQSVVPGKLMSYFGASKGFTIPPHEAWPWVKQAFPQDDAGFTPAAIASVKTILSQRFCPRWITKILPMDRVNALPAAKDPPKVLSYSSEQFIGFAPQMHGDKWIHFPLAVFDLPDGSAGEPITMYDDKGHPVFDIVVPKDGTGYYTDETFFIHHHYEVEPDG